MKAGSPAAPLRILDFHTHPWRPEDFAAETTAFIRRISPAVQEHGDRLHDPVYCADLLRAQGVRHAVLLAEHCPRTSGNVRTETILELCAAADDFFLPFASVDPMSDDDPAGLLRRYVGLGVRGLKLYPSYQFWYPNDPSVYPLYEICLEAGIPVLMHIGSSVLKGTRLKYCDPIHLDDVAVDFPELPLVMAHGGRGFWYEPCAFLATHKENLYIDVAGLVPGQLRDFYPRLERLAPKLVFGSDWPALPRSVAGNAAAIAQLGLEPDAVDRILYRNAAALLNVGD
ncbi:MAG: amidohydrolase family protein [Gemmatimonadetes bacterium]|nr:amidohydrolase family protein [Gemmatimonadota bacterium]